MNKTIGILAHVDAGKTTFAEQVLYHTKSIRSKGRVDHKDAFLDSHSIEKERGITVFSDQGVFSYGKSNYYLIDTPGHIDFSPEMERAMQIMDYAIIILSAVEGIQAHTETIWQLLRKNKVPTFFFINKIDRNGANVQGLVQEMKEELGEDIFYIEKPFFNDQLGGDESKANYDMDELLIEFLAERDSNLLDTYLEKGYDRELWIDTMKKMIKENRVFPCFSGAALQDVGVIEFLNSLENLTYTEYNSREEFSGRVYKIRYDEKGNRVTYIKALSGEVRVRDEISYKLGDETYSEKVTDIRVYNGNKFKVKDNALAGEVFAVTGLTMVKAGIGVGAIKDEVHYDLVPTLKSKVIYDKTLNVKDVLSYFKILEAEDPSLNVVWDETLKEIDIHIMGVIQLEVLKEIVKDRFKLEVEFGPCQILYKETINGAVMGCGHFEPLGHYAEVILKLEKGERNSGITFYNNCHADDLTVGHQNLIKTHIFEKEHHGLLTGSPLTDLKITLLTGRAHNKHTSGGDFREATYRALRQGLEKAENALLEPYYKFKISVELDYMGRVLSDIQKLNGIFSPTKIIGEKAVIEGRGPVSKFMNYSLELISFTKGKWMLNLVFDGYDYCHNSDAVIEEKDYKKEADIEYTSTSIFCSKGQSYLVKWQDAESEMHCLK